MDNRLQKIHSRITAAVARVHPFVLLVICIGVLLAYLAGMYVTGSFHSASRWMGAMLACTSVVVVLQRPGYKDSLQVGWMRVFSTFVGVLVAYAYLSIFPFTVVGMLASVFVLEMIFMLLNIYNNGHIATMTMLIILLVSQMTPGVDPIVNCLLRFFESAVGVGVGIALLWLIEQWNKLRRRLLRLGGNSDGNPVDMDTMPLRWGHFRVLIVASLGQATGASLATLVGVVIPMLQLLLHPELPAFAQGAVACTSLVGIMVGSMCFGEWSDKRGYLRYFRLCPLLVLAAALLGCFAANLPGLIVSLFLMGLGIGGDYSLDSDYISEIMPRRWRLFMVGVAKAFSSLGNILTAAACFYLLRAWQSPDMWNRLLLLVALLAAAMLLTRVRFVQSPGWLVAQGRMDDAERAARYFLGPDVTLGELRNRPQQGAAAAPRPSWRDLFRGRNLRRVIFSGIPWACEGAGVYGIGVFLPVLIMSLGLGKAAAGSFAGIVESVETSVYVNLVILPGFLLGLLFVNRMSHLRMQIGGFLLCSAGLALLLAAHLLRLPAWAAVAGFMIFELFLNAGPHLMTFIIPPQIYPVDERGAGAGLAAAMGKFGGVAGVLFIPVLLKWGGMTLVLSAVIVVLLAGAFVSWRFGRGLLPQQSPQQSPQQPQR